MVNDRYKFRAVFNVPYTLEDGTEQIALVKIDNVGVHLNYGVCFELDDLDVAIKALKLDEEQSEEIEDYFESNNSCRDDDFFWVHADEVMQCTGVKDKNGKLIYEGDTVYYKFGHLGWQNAIVKTNKANQFGVYGKKDCGYGSNVIFMPLNKNCEVI